MNQVPHLATRDLDHYLQRNLPAAKLDAIRHHLTDCDRCWDTWNRHRWDAAKGSRLLEDLKSFLGPEFRPYYDSSRGLAKSWDRANPQTPSEVATFFRNSTDYLYNLAIWQASGNRPPYVTEALPTLRAIGVHTILDYGCGIGNDTIPLSDSGFAVTGCDFLSPSTAFLSWRTGNAIPVIEPSQIDEHPTPDALWIIDTLDHLDNINDAIGPLLSRVPIVVTENVAIERGHNRKRFHHRRTRDQLHRIFGAHGLRSKATAQSKPIAVWQRHSAQPT